MVKRDHSLLAHAVDQILNRIRLLALEMCPSDRQKLEAVVARAFQDLSQISALEAKTLNRDVH